MTKFIIQIHNKCININKNKTVILANNQLPNVSGFKQYNYNKY